MLMAKLLAALWLAVMLPRAASAADAAAGAALYRTKCAMCHDITPGKHIRPGPTLFGLLGRKAGSVPDYNYTEANRNSSKTWDAATLNTYLADPRAVIPGTRMAMAGISDETDRADLIAYLATLK